MSLLHRVSGFKPIEERVFAIRRLAAPSLLGHARLPSCAAGRRHSHGYTRQRGGGSRLEDRARRSAGRGPTPLVLSQRVSDCASVHNHRGSFAALHAPSCSPHAQVPMLRLPHDHEVGRAALSHIGEDCSSQHPQDARPHQRWSQSPTAVCHRLRARVHQPSRLRACRVCVRLAPATRPASARCLAGRGGWGEHGARRRQRVGARARAGVFLAARLTRATLTIPTRDTRRLSGATRCPTGRQRVCQTWRHADTSPRGQRAMARCSLGSPPRILTIVVGGRSHTTL
jgi:hypothetical protein